MALAARPPDSASRRYGGTLDRVCKSAKTPIFSEIGKTEKSQKSEK
jgi:hypothetical protein